MVSFQHASSSPSSADTYMGVGSWCGSAYLFGGGCAGDEIGVVAMLVGMEVFECLIGWFRCLIGLVIESCSSAYWYLIQYEGFRLCS